MIRLNLEVVVRVADCGPRPGIEWRFKRKAHGDQEPREDHCGLVGGGRRRHRGELGAGMHEPNPKHHIRPQRRQSRGLGLARQWNSNGTIHCPACTQA